MASPTASEAAAAGATVPDLREVTVARGTRVLCTSDIHLYPSESNAATRMVEDLSQRLDTWAGAGVLVLAGDCFEGLAADLDVGRELDMHPDFERAILAFSKRPNCEVHLLPGNHDGQIAWDPVAQEAIRTRLGADIAMRVDLLCDTGEGVKKVRVQHGNSYDASNAFMDPRDPVDTPLGHHVVREVLPTLRDKPGSLLEGLEWLGDPQQVLPFLGSRLAYRQVIRRAWWIFVPFIIAFIIKALASFGLFGDDVGWSSSWREWITNFGLIVVVDLVVIMLLLLVVSKRVQEGVMAAKPGGHDTVKNETPKRAAQSLVLEQGYAGLVSGHTHYPELVGIPGGFYANDGCGVETVEARESRFGMPATFGAVLRQSWVIIEAGDQLGAELYVSDVPVASSDPLERLVARPGRAPTTPTMVASWPAGPFYPVRAPKLAFAKKRINVRKHAAFGAVVLGALMVVGAAIPPLASRLEVLLEWVPLMATQVSAGIMVDVGLWLILASRGLRRGQREAWWATVALLTIALVLTLLHGFAFETLLLPLIGLAWLLAKRDYFKGKWDRHALRRAIAIFVIGNVVMVTAAVVFIGVLDAESDIPDNASNEQIADDVGRDSQTDFDGKLGDLAWMFAIVGAGIVVAAGWALFGSQRHRKLSPDEQAHALADARTVWNQYGRGSLSYFTLRSDREWFFSENAVVAYTLQNGTCVLSNDPVCPIDDREDLWADFADFADQHGWGIAVLAASEQWLGVYEAAGMEAFHLGDEAILSAARFDPTADAPEATTHHEALAKAGWTGTIHTIAEVRASDSLTTALTELVETHAELGDVFTIGLNRFLDPSDDRVLVTVIANPEGVPVATAQFVPAPELDGYTISHLFSADDRAEVLDFAVIETIIAMRDRGARELSFNVIATPLGDEDDADSDVVTRAERRRLRRLTDVMQVSGRETLERFAPQWKPRWVMVEPQRRAMKGAVRAGREHSGLEAIIPTS